MTEDQLEQQYATWFAETGWEVHHGPEIAPDGCNPLMKTSRLRKKYCRVGDVVEGKGGVNDNFITGTTIELFGTMAAGETPCFIPK